MQGINDEPAKKCPDCLQETAVRLVSAAGFQLKGTGWYATDFKNKTPATHHAASTTASSKTTDKTSESTASTKGESN